MYRVFGSPFVLTLHQHVTYLRLKNLPFKVYCTNITTTLLYSLFYRARNTFCTVTPGGQSCLQIWQLLEAVELDEETSASRSTGALAALKNETNLPGGTKPHSSGRVLGEEEGTRELVTTQSQVVRILLDKRVHPLLHTASWAIVLYSCWWLSKTGALYRWVLGTGLDVVEGYLRYFFLIPGVGMARSVAKPFRETMKKAVATSGVSEETALYMDEHFKRLCAALDAHFKASSERQSNGITNDDFFYLLGTPHPTIADVALGSVFAAYFCMDDPPASLITEKYPFLCAYIEHATGWKGGQFIDRTDSKGDENKFNTPDKIKRLNREDYPDVIPETLDPIFELLEEVFPFMMSQCAAFNAYMTSDSIRSLKREPLEGRWKGCHGYLFPQLTDIKSLMIINNSVHTVNARSQDLELAFMASREIMIDDTLGDFNRIVERSNSTFTKADSKSDISTISTSGCDAHRKSKNPEMSLVNLQVDVSKMAKPGSHTETDTKIFKLIEKAEDIVDSEEADFYRVLTKDQQRTPMLRPATRSKNKPSRELAVQEGISSATRRLLQIKEMMLKMSSPQYTLTTVFHGRKMYVAAIPEYEVQSVRLTTTQK